MRPTPRGKRRTRGRKGSRNKRKDRTPGPYGPGGAPSPETAGCGSTLDPMGQGGHRPLKKRLAGEGYPGPMGRGGYRPLGVLSPRMPNRGPTPAALPQAALSAIHRRRQGGSATGRQVAAHRRVHSPILIPFFVPGRTGLSRIFFLTLLVSPCFFLTPGRAKKQHGGKNGPKTLIQSQVFSVCFQKRVL